jgi:hypothetical protein
MARRGGKAANRKAKQRKAQRPVSAPRPAAPMDAAASGESFAADPMRAEAPAAVATPAAPREIPARESTRKVTRDPRSMVAGPSRLSERAQQEYHYVQRDLRNIGVLVVIMAAILVVAYVVFNVMGIARAA